MLNYKRKLMNLDDTLAKTHPYGIEVSSDPDGYYVWELSYYKSKDWRDSDFANLPYIDIEENINV